MGGIAPEKNLALIKEFETANELIRLGFGELQNINLDNDFYFLPFQLLSQGFERFMKSYICVGHFENYSTLPKPEYLKDLGHDLKDLLSDIINNYFVDYTQEQVALDCEFLNTDDDLKELFYILSEFGKISRYYNFDFITDNAKIGINPEEKWQKFENKIVPNNEKNMRRLMDHDVDHEIYQEITNYIIIVFEKFVASLSRQIIFGTLGSTGKQVAISPFLDYGLLYEGDFGKTDYRKNTNKYKEKPKSIHKRTIIDQLKRKYSPHYKSKKVTINEYTGQWPFYVDEVIIECIQNHWCIVSINGYDYALNGAAKGRFKLEKPHDAGMAILGRSLSDFIEMAKNLK